MLLHDYLKLPEWVSLAFIAVSLIAGIVASVRKSSKEIV
jgi:tellurite resistance protein TerC